MSKEMTAVRLNEIQLATYNELAKQSVTTGSKRAVPGVVPADVAVTYKQNVINALIRAGVLYAYRNNFRLAQGVVAVLRAPVKHRTPREAIA